MTASAIAENIVRMPRKRPQRVRATVVHLTEEELQRLMKAAKEDGPRTHAMTLLGYKHAMRCSEIVNLERKHLDLKNGQVDVRRRKNSLRTVQPLMPQRGCPLFDEPKVLKTYLDVRPEDKTDYVFVSQKGGALDRTQFFRIFQRICEAADIPREKRFPHVLKHTRASLFIQNGGELAHAKQLLGHKSISSTAIYAQVSDQQAAQAAMRIDAEMF